jgi:hypothetical protein
MLLWYHATALRQRHDSLWSTNQPGLKVKTPLSPQRQAKAQPSAPASQPDTYECVERDDVGPAAFSPHGVVCFECQAATAAFDAHIHERRVAARKGGGGSNV